MTKYVSLNLNFAEMWEFPILCSTVTGNMQDMVISPKSNSKLVKDDDQFEDAKANSKRKRTPGKDKVLVLQIIDYVIFLFHCVHVDYKLVDVTLMVVQNALLTLFSLLLGFI